MPHINSYYAATAANPNFPELTENIEVKTCIIGAGFAGLATAIGLAERGDLDQVLIDAKSVAWGASGRNGGFVFGGYSLEPQPLHATLGLESARQLYRLTQDAVNLIRQRIQRYHIDCDMRDSGVMLVDWFNDEKALREKQRFMRENYSVDWEFLDKQVVSDILRSRRYYSGLREANAFHFHPLKYAQAIAGRLQDLGVGVHENTPAIKIKASKNVYKIQTPHAEIIAENVVYAGGAYQNTLQRKLRRSMLPIATYVIATEPCPNLLDQVIRTDSAIYDTRFAFDYYRRLSDGRLLWGGRINTRHWREPAIRKKLLNDIKSIFPELGMVNIDFAWGGLMSYARHQMPQIGRIDKNYWFAQAFGGHGVAPTTVAGESLAAAIAEGIEPNSEFKRFGLSPTFGTLGKCFAQGQYWAYQIADWLRSPR